MLIPIGLFLAGVLGIIIEFFVPTAGILGVFGGGVIVWSVVMVYREFGTAYGMVFLGIAIVTAPVLIFFYFKVFPKSIVGRRLILQGKQSIESGYNSVPERTLPSVGDVGRCISALRPSGSVQFECGNLSAITQGEFIETGQRVVVTKIEGNRIHVGRKTGEDTPKEENA
jgi:membrane-bound serine protease (ClpP class)